MVVHPLQRCEDTGAGAGHSRITLVLTWIGSAWPTLLLGARWARTPRPPSAAPHRPYSASLDCHTIDAVWRIVHSTLLPMTGAQPLPAGLVGTPTAGAACMSPGATASPSATLTGCPSTVTPEGMPTAVTTTGAELTFGDREPTDGEYAIRSSEAVERSPELLPV